MRKTIQILLFFTFLPLIPGCYQNSTDKEISIGDPELTEFEQQEILTKEKNASILYHYPDILSGSLKGLTLIKNNWKSSYFLCSENEIFILIKKVSQNRIIAISSLEFNHINTFYFYDLNEKGEILGKEEIQHADYSINNRYNFIVDNNSIYYFTKKTEQKELVYSLENHTHSYSNTNNLDWEKIENWKKHSEFVSPNNKYSIEITGVNLIFTNLKNHRIDTLISQVYDGTWSFGNGCWNSNSSKFYFDNSGAVACIWELDLKNKTLDKIVPEHWASSPNLITDSANTVILYCEEGCIKKTELKNFKVHD